MGWADLAGSVGALAASGSESERFGFDVERISVGRGWREDFASLEELGAQLDGILQGSSADLVILRMPSELQALPAMLLGQGRRVIPAGTLMYWELNVKNAPTASVPGDIETREVRSLAHGSADLASAMLLITDSFAGYTNHYSANPRLDPDVVAQGYLQWAESTLTGQSSRGFLISDQSGVVGCATVVSVGAGESAWEIELAGMSTKRQGKGLYRYLLEAVRSAALRDGIDKIFISTQSHNIRVQRAWARAGFVPVAAVDTLHLMR